MPIYEYECQKCGAHLEVLQKMGDKPLTRCTKCKGKVQKAISRSSFQLKGSGWYATDYAKKPSGGSSEESKESKPETTSKTKSETTSETKPETKTESAPAAASTTSTPTTKAD